MITDVSITVKSEEEKNEKLIQKKLKEALAQKQCSTADSVQFVFEKKSVDARHGRVRIFLRYKAYIDEVPLHNDECALPAWKDVHNAQEQILIVGAGPAGLFGALTLLEHGIRPIIVERGRPTSERKRDIAAISTQGIVDEDSNYCFGEGGAGTFSDGKLYTRSTKRGDVGLVYRLFVHFGADEAILTDAHPHIGTDRLPKIINNIRNFIVQKGGIILFNTRCTDFLYNAAANKVQGIIALDTQTHTQTTLTGSAVMLATGHSATDVYMLLAQKFPTALEAKPFAMGVRVEHPRAVIDAIQYHGAPMQSAAEYRLTSQQNGRGVYSFCMCPGGFVVPSASGSAEIVVNGMSAAKRNSRWSNAAIVVETRTEDIPQKFVQMAQDVGCNALAGLFYRTYIEQLTKEHGCKQAAPAQRLEDFLAKQHSVSLPESSYTPGLVSSRLDDWLPPAISARLASGFIEFNKTMRGFISSNAVLIASETRTSTPVRIMRNRQTLECSAVQGLYPAGEGSGYSGGIVSSAIDGMNVCKQIALLCV